MDYYEKYIKYKKKYLNAKYECKKMYEISGEDNICKISNSGTFKTAFGCINSKKCKKILDDYKKPKYSLINLEEIYKLESYDIKHRPSSINNDFNQKKNIYTAYESIFFENKYFSDFTKIYKQKHIVRVKYFNKDELISRHCTIQNNKIMSEYLLPRVQNNSKDLTNFIYILTPNGDLYLTDKGEKFKEGDIELQTNHTSMSRGSKVSSAGWLTLNKDYNVTEIYNSSGHYNSSYTLTSTNPTIYNILHHFLLNKINLEHLKIKFLVGVDDKGKNIDLKIDQTTGEYVEVENKKIYSAIEFYDYEKEREHNKKPLSEFDYIKYELSSKFYDLQLIGDFLVLDAKSRVIDTIFIFNDNESFIKYINANKKSLHSSFNLVPLSEYFDKELTYFIFNKIEVLKLRGTFYNFHVNMYLFSYDTYDFEKSAYMRYMTKNEDIRVYANKNLMNDELVEILKLNKTLNKNTVVTLDKNFYFFNEIIVVGEITELLLNSRLEYSLGGFFFKFIELLKKKLIKFIAEQKSMCSLEMVNMPNFKEIYSKFKQAYCVLKKSYVVYDLRLFDLVIDNKIFNNEIFKIDYRVRKGNKVINSYDKDKFKLIVNNSSDREKENLNYLRIKNFYEHNDIISFNKNYTLKYIRGFPMSNLFTEGNYNKIIKIELRLSEDILNGFLKSINQNSISFEIIKSFNEAINKWDSYKYDEVFDSDVTINCVKYNKITKNMFSDYLNLLNNNVKVFGYLFEYDNIICVEDSNNCVFKIETSNVVNSHPCHLISNFIYYLLFENTNEFELKEYQDNNFVFDYSLSENKKKILDIKMNLIVGNCLNKIKENLTFDKNLLKDWETILRQSIALLVLFKKPIAKKSFEFILVHELINDFFVEEKKILKYTDTKLLYINELINKINYEIL